MWSAKGDSCTTSRSLHDQLHIRELVTLFLFDRSLYGDLSRAAYASTRDFLRSLAPAGFTKLKKAVPAMVVVPQSFGELLVAHPHAHALCSLGLFLRDGTFYSNEDVDFSGLEAIFRERVFDFMIEKEKITREAADDMRAWPHSGFGLDFQRKIEAGDRKGLEGLLSYMDPSGRTLRVRLRARVSGPTGFAGTRPLRPVHRSLLGRVEPTHLASEAHLSA